MSDDQRIVVPDLDFTVTPEDAEAGRLAGATGAEVVESVINTALDRQGVPREGREVRVRLETIMVELPPGYRFESDDD